jgi:DNA adenine methylase
VEPFLGGGAVFFALRPARASLSDANGALIDAYAGVRTQPEKVVARLRRWQVSADTFAAVRDSLPRSIAGKAARFIYLNRTAFNGLYRVNRMGKFNVPYGCKPGTTSFDLEAINRAALQLQSAELSIEDFSRGFERASDEALIYADPPYVLPCSSGYARYTQMAFTWADQARLAEAACTAVSRGCRVVISNAYSREIISLYPRKHFDIFGVRRASRMAANPLHRGSRIEVVVLSRTLPKSTRATFSRSLEAL